jgi:predicted RNase H-like HicB family nuclease
MATKNYLIILEPGHRSWGAYSPDLPGRVATGKRREETLERMQEAVMFHIDGLRAEGMPVPEPLSSAEYLAMPA